MKNKPRHRSPERAAIHDQTNREGAGILLLCTTTGRLLLGLRGMDCASPETWAPFGGMVEPGESTIEGAVREMMEEAGVDVLQPDVVIYPQTLYVNHDAATGFRFTTYLATVSYEPAVTINEESSGYAWVRNVRSYWLHPGFEELTRDTRVKEAILQAMT